MLSNTVAITRERGHKDPPVNLALIRQRLRGAPHSVAGDNTGLSAFPRFAHTPGFYGTRCDQFSLMCMPSMPCRCASPVRWVTRGKGGRCLRPEPMPPSPFLPFGVRYQPRIRVCPGRPKPMFGDGGVDCHGIIGCARLPPFARVVRPRQPPMGVVWVVLVFRLISVGYKMSCDLRRWLWGHGRGIPHVVLPTPTPLPDIVPTALQTLEHHEFDWTIDWLPGQPRWSRLAVRSLPADRHYPLSLQGSLC